MCTVSLTSWTRERYSRSNASIYKTIAGGGKRRRKKWKEGREEEKGGGERAVKEMEGRRRKKDKGKEKIITILSL